MELKASSLKCGGLSSSDYVSDPEEKEVSDEEDDDRNHKHRRRDTRSQSLERDSLEPVFTRPYRKRNKPFENGHAFRESDSQASETWKNYNAAPLQKEFSAKFEKRRPGMASLPRMPLDLSQRIRSNQSFSGDLGFGRGRDSGSWNLHDSRFNSVDIASQMVQQGPITPGLFAGRGLPNITNAQNASWNAFGLIPGIPNGGLDTLHSISLQGTLRPAVNSSLSVGIPRQRCRDFEERGFCLRGDMCPMEHGVNRIIVKDVQSLSQFNLPVSLASSQLVGAPAGPGALPTAGASTTLMNSKAVHGRSSKPGMVDDGLGLNSAYSGSASVSGADLYDPDQPLWNNNAPETCDLLSLNSPKNDETESLTGVDPSDRHHLRLDGSDNEYPIRSNVTLSSQSTSTSVWGRISSLKNRLDMKEKTDSFMSTSDYMENESKEDQDALTNIQGTSRQEKWIIAKDAGAKTVDLSGKTQIDTMHNTRKPSQKALRTLFVNGIPLKSNKREVLLSHFQKFGEVIDIYIPLNSERAFVQFSKREEAEAALRAPDAVMGNRFIKLWWANRDSIPDDGISSGGSVSLTPRGVAGASVLPHPFIANRGKDNLQPTAVKGTIVHPCDASLLTSDQPKSTITDGPKVHPPFQKKLESLEQLKEALRKKQELLDQKRNDFRQQLDKLEKQATGVKGEVVSEPAGKRHKVGIAADVVKATTPRSSDSGAGVATLHTEILVDKNKSVENIASASPKMNTGLMLRDPAGLKQPIRPFAPVGVPFLMNKYKLDNRPTAFRIMPPLPAGLANVATLKEYFSSFGDLSNVDLEDIEPSDDVDGIEKLKNCSACVTFKTRQSAERAFLNGKCWQGNKLHFMWVTSNATGNNPGVKENLRSAPTSPVEADVRSAEKLACMDSQEASASGNGVSGTSERSIGVDNMELQEVSQARPTSIFDEKESPKRESSAASTFPEEGLLKHEPSPPANSAEKESPEEDDC